MEKRVLLEKILVAQLVKKFPAFYGTKGSLRYSQKLATEPYPNPVHPLAPSNDKHRTILKSVVVAEEHGFVTHCRQMAAGIPYPSGGTARSALHFLFLVS
jgi:hypothetical protein